MYGKQRSEPGKHTGQRISFLWNYWHPLSSHQDSAPLYALDKTNLRFHPHQIDKHLRRVH